MTGYNLFVKTNMPAFDESGTLVNYSDFHASMGSLPLPENLNIQDDADVVSGIEMTWQDDSDTGIGNADDKLHLLVMTSEKVHILNAAAVRSDKSAEITLPVPAGDVHVYSFFGTAAGDKFSPDLYSKIILS